jgi:hypothetical protein
VLRWIVPNLSASITLVYVYQITLMILNGFLVQVTSGESSLLGVG